MLTFRFFFLPFTGLLLQAVSLVASYLDVPLRYPLRLGGSRSYIFNHAPSFESTSTDLISSPIVGMNTKATEFPLFLEGQDTTKAAYAIFLLNKVCLPFMFYSTFYRFASRKINIPGHTLNLFIFWIIDIVKCLQLEKLHVSGDICSPIPLKSKTFK